MARRRSILSIHGRQTHRIGLNDASFTGLLVPLLEERQRISICGNYLVVQTFARVVFSQPGKLFRVNLLLSALHNF